MKQVVLFGDSIRLGYRAHVARELEGVAEVWSPDENCETSLKILASWWVWLDGKTPDILHINCGLHDVKTLLGTTREILVPVENYQRNLERVFAALHEKRPQTKLIFATTTPVVESATTNTENVFCRYNSDIEAANDAAKEICGRFGVEINDLWALVQENGPENMLNPDGVHFSDENSRILGEVVAAKIQNCLRSNGSSISAPTGGA